MNSANGALHFIALSWHCIIPNYIHIGSKIGPHGMRGERIVAAPVAIENYAILAGMMASISISAAIVLSSFRLPPFLLLHPHIAQNRN
jgi:hypothetical protein